MTMTAERLEPSDARCDKAARFVVAVNPSAGGKSRLAAEVAAQLSARGLQVELETAERPGHIRRLAQSTTAGALLVAGGDGSINEAARGLLARPDQRPALGVIPHGTANVLTRALNLPRDPVALAEIFTRGETRKLHVGLANGHPFVLMASAGFDAAVVETVDLGLKKRFGRLAYALAAGRTLARGDFPDIEAQTDAGTLRGRCVVVAKSKFYGGPFVIDPAADVAKPGFQVVALSEISPRATLALARYFINGRPDSGGLVQKLAARRVTLLGDAPVQIDGDYLGRAPIEICEAPETLDVLA